MSDEEKASNQTTYVRKYVNKSSGIGFAYFLAMIGAAVYYLQQAMSFGDGFIGLLKAFVWPAFLVYHLLAH